MPEAKAGVVPELRFPEFQDAGPWEVKRLGDLGPVLMCKRVMKDQTASTGDVPFYKIGTFGKQADAYINRDLYEEFKSKYSFPQKGDILISAAGTIGRTVVYDGEPAYFQDSNIVWIANDEELATNEFLNFAYQKVNWRTDDNTIARLYNDNLRSIKVAFPSLPEQRKIADCLGSLDELIRADERRLEALSAHKTGLMQRLFPAPGQTTPRLRFPEFEGAGPWEMKRLGDREIARFIRERVAAEDVPLGHYVSTVNLLPDFCGLSPEPEKPPAGSAIAYREGDILMSNIRPYLQKVWVADRSGGASNDVLVARPSKSVVKSFLSQFLMSERFISHVMGGAKGVKMPRGDLEQIQDFEVPLPARPEQQKIADCLTALDDLIGAQGETIEALKTHKRGLMQKLFPREVG